MIKIPDQKLVGVGRLKIDGDNPNIMSNEQREALKKNINKFGFLVPIITNKDYLIADGEQRFMVAKDMGMKEVPVIKLDITDIDRRTIRQVMNKVVGVHKPDLDALEFKKIFESGNENELKSLLALSDSDLERHLHATKDSDEEIKKDIKTVERELINKGFSAEEARAMSEVYTHSPTKQGKVDIQGTQQGIRFCVTFYFDGEEEKDKVKKFFDTGTAELDTKKLLEMVENG